jgi:O-antigen/teichoic acid export membrane protein
MQIVFLPSGAWPRRVLSRLASWLSQRPGLRSVLSNSGWMMVDRVVRMALALLVGAWVARHLGPGRYGELAYVLAIVVLWQTVSSLGLESIVVRDLAHGSAPASTILGTVFGLRVAASVLCWAATAATVAVLVPDNTMALVVAIILGSGIVFQMADLVDQWFQSRTQSRYTVLPRLVACIVASLVKVVMVLGNAPLWAFAAAFLCDTALAAAALAWAYRRQSAPRAWLFDRALAVRLLREAWPLLVAGLSVAIYMRIDVLILRALAGESQVGLYSAILPISTAFHFVPMTVCASVLPRLSLLRTTDPERYALRMQQLFSGMAWGGIAVAGLTALAAPLAVSLLLGPAYEGAVPVLQWHALSNVFLFLGVAQSVAIIGDRTPRIALYRTLFGAAISASANAALVPQWGAVGAAWAAIASYFGAAVLSNTFLAPHYLRMQLRAFWPFHAK